MILFIIKGFPIIVFIFIVISTTFRLICPLAFFRCLCWAPHMVCKACTETLCGWTSGKRRLNFWIPMVWWEPTNHVIDYYFCAVDVTGINRKNRGSLKHPDLQSARRPVAHCDEIPLPIFGELPDISDEDASSVEGREDEEVILKDDVPHPFSQK